MTLATFAHRKVHLEGAVQLLLGPPGAHLTRRVGRLSPTARGLGMGTWCPMGRDPAAGTQDLDLYPVPYIQCRAPVPKRAIANGFQDLWRPRHQAHPSGVN